MPRNWNVGDIDIIKSYGVIATWDTDHISLLWAFDKSIRANSVRFTGSPAQVLNYIEMWMDTEVVKIEDER